MNALSERGGAPTAGRLSEQAYEHVRRGILSGDYPIGSVVSGGHSPARANAGSSARRSPSSGRFIRFRPPPSCS